MPVSLTAKASDCGARGAMRSRTLPCRVNLKALASRFFSTCLSRVASVRTLAGSPGAISIEKASPFSRAISRKPRSSSSRKSASGVGAMCNAVSAPASILARSRRSLMSERRSIPEA